MNIVLYVEKYKAAYGQLPKKTPADAGYESYENYSYYKEKKNNRKNKSNKNQMKRTEEGGFICSTGHEFELVKVTEDSRSEYGRINILFKNNHCEGCPMRSNCTKSKHGRTINHFFQLEEHQTEVRENVTSEEGIKLMYQRSNEAEGTFGDWKANYKYDKLRRRGMTGVKVEITLMAIAHNIRKYHRYKHQKKDIEDEIVIN